MQIDIRPAAVEDAAAACAVVRRSIVECCADDHRGDPVLIEAWLRNKTVADMRAWLQAAGAHAVVAVAGGGVVGFALSRGDAILLCHVVPEARFKGVGKALLLALEAHAARAGVACLRLESTRTARAFYARNGFVPTGPAVAVFGMEGQPMAKPVAAGMWSG